MVEGVEADGQGSADALLARAMPNSMCISERLDEK
jgi:hypothetical protein